ncbi:uncharacterized protein LOC134230516 [Saccostrea cucullata]|uniref:uncharacterized protein LOC134230516 n=1 Tax=Saccostrea cuccullata TaxID=36930 RepID=UPI002ED5F98A
MNEYRNILTGEAAIAWRNLISRLRYHWTTDNKIFEHLLEVHEWFCGDKCPLLRSDVADEADQDFPMSTEDERTAMSLELEVEDGAESIDDDSSGESNSDTESGEEDVYIKEEEEEVISAIPCKIVSSEPRTDIQLLNSRGDKSISEEGNFVPLAETLGSVSEGSEFENNSTNRSTKQQNTRTSCLDDYRKTSNAKTCNENGKVTQGESKTFSNESESQKAMLEKKLLFKLPQREKETFLNVYELHRNDRTEAPQQMEKKLLRSSKSSLLDNPTSSTSSTSSDNRISAASTQSSIRSDKPDSSKSELTKSNSKFPKPSSLKKPKSSKSFLRKKRSKILNTEGVRALKSHLSSKALSHKNNSTESCGSHDSNVSSVEEVPQIHTINRTPEAAESSTSTRGKGNGETVEQTTGNGIEVKPGVSKDKPPISLMLDINPHTGIPCLVRYPTTAPDFGNVNQGSSDMKSNQMETDVSSATDSVNPSGQGMSSLINLRLTIDPVSGKPMLVKCMDEPSTSDCCDTEVQSIVKCTDETSTSDCCDTRKLTSKTIDHEESGQIPNFSMLTPVEVLNPKQQQLKLIRELSDISRRIPSFQNVKPKPIDLKPKRKLKRKRIRRNLQDRRPKISDVKAKQMPVVQMSKQSSNSGVIEAPQILNSQRPDVQKSPIAQKFEPTLKQHEYHSELIGQPQVFLGTTTKEPKKSPETQKSKPLFNQSVVTVSPKKPNILRSVVQKPRQLPVVKTSTVKQNDLIGEPQVLRNLLEEPMQLSVVKSSKPAVKQNNIKEELEEPHVLSNLLDDPTPTLNQTLPDEPQVLRNLLEEPIPTVNLTLVINPTNGMPMLVPSPDIMTANPNDTHLKLTLDPVSGDTVLVPETKDDPEEGVS